MNNKKYKKAYLIGMPKSGLVSLRREIMYRYNLVLINYYPYIYDVSPAINNQNILVICLVKDPYFWYKSLNNDKSLLTTSSGNLLNYLVFNGKGYDNIISLYNRYLKNYLNHSIFPVTNNIIIRYEDYLLKYHQTIEYLDTKFLVKKEVGLPFPINNKENEWYNYGDKYRLENRYLNISNNELYEIAQNLDNNLLLKLNYNPKKEVIKVFSLNSENLDLFNKNNNQENEKKLDKLDTLSQCSKNCQTDNHNVDEFHKDYCQYGERKLLKPKKIKYLDTPDIISEKKEDITLEYKKAYKINYDIGENGQNSQRINTRIPIQKSNIENLLLSSNNYQLYKKIANIATNISQ